MSATQIPLTSLEMLAEGGAFDHFKELGFYRDVGPFLNPDLHHQSISREEAGNLLRCADLGIDAAISGKLTHKAMMVLYKTGVGLPKKAERDSFARTVREARRRGLKSPPSAFGDQPN